MPRLLPPRGYEEMEPSDVLGLSGAAVIPRGVYPSLVAKVLRSIPRPLRNILTQQGRAGVDDLQVAVENLPKGILGRSEIRKPFVGVAPEIARGATTKEGYSPYSVLRHELQHELEQRAPLPLQAREALEEKAPFGSLLRLALSEGAGRVREEFPAYLSELATRKIAPTKAPAFLLEEAGPELTDELGNEFVRLMRRHAGAARRVAKQAARRGME